MSVPPVWHVSKAIYSKGRAHIDKMSWSINMCSCIILITFSAPRDEYILNFTCQA